MTDAGRKDFSTKAKESATPDSQKSYLDSAKETVTDATDKASGAVQPDSEKSTAQSLGDKASGTKDDAKSGSGSTVDSVKNTLGLGDK